MAWCFLKKNKKRVSIQSRNSASECIPKRIAGTTSKTHVSSHVHSSAIRESERRKQPKCSSVNKMWRRHTVAYCLALKRKDVLTHATVWMQSEDPVLSEVSPSRTGRYYVIALIRGTRGSRTRRGEVEWWLPGAGSRERWGIVF